MFVIMLLAVDGSVARHGLLCRPATRAWIFGTIYPQLALWATDMSPATPAAKCPNFWDPMRGPADASSLPVVSQTTLNHRLQAAIPPGIKHGGAAPYSNAYARTPPGVRKSSLLTGGVAKYAQPPATGGDPYRDQRRPR